MTFGPILPWRVLTTSFVCLLLAIALAARPGQAGERTRRVVVLIPGLATELQAQDVRALVDDCERPAADEVFGHLKERLVRTTDFDCDDFLNYSYQGSASPEIRGRRFYPPSYTAAHTGQAIEDSAVPALGRWLELYADRRSNERLEFVLVGHGLGGIVALEYGRKVADARKQRREDGVANVVAVMTIDSPVLGMSDEERMALARRLRSTEAGSRSATEPLGELPELLAESRAGAALGRRWRESWSQTAERLDDQGIATYTTGNRRDCL